MFEITIRSGTKKTIVTVDFSPNVHGVYNNDDVGNVLIDELERKGFNIKNVFKHSEGKYL